MAEWKQVTFGAKGLGQLWQCGMPLCWTTESLGTATSFKSPVLGAVLAFQTAALLFGWFQKL